MPKFKKGDKVVSVKTGAQGVVDEVYGEEKYAVLFDGAANPDRVEGFQIRLANSRVRNGKFKVGDRVWVPAKQKRGVIRGVSATGNQYDVEFMGGGGAYVNEDGLEFLQALGNSDAPVSANSVVRNAMAARVARNASQEDTMVKACANECGKARSILDDWRDHARILAGESKKFARAKPEFDKAYAALVAAMNIVGA